MRSLKNTPIDIFHWSTEFIEALPETAFLLTFKAVYIATLKDFFRDRDEVRLKDLQLKFAKHSFGL